MQDGTLTERDSHLGLQHEDANAGKEPARQGVQPDHVVGDAEEDEGDEQKDWQLGNLQILGGRSKKLFQIRVTRKIMKRLIVLLGLAIIDYFGKTKTKVERATTCLEIK